MVPPEGELSQEDIDALLGGDADALSEEGLDSLLSETGDDQSSAGAVAAPVSTAEKGAINENTPEALFDVDINLKIRFGRNSLSVENILSLGDGAVVELDKFIDEPVDILANGTLVARGEIMVVNEKVGVKIKEIVSQKERLQALLSGNTP